ncbi:ectoine/hydroxyectoine ABC transporter substrate-binding protein EhuB [Mesorhizobium sp. M1060]|uniref:ectoine/hydroxyectoine ABC transporter substrate-binding protein EhuB n=1 Tax=Mesorhizobium sp. M1060 TaxID=2957052 RepID=UPI00333C6427
MALKSNGSTRKRAIGFGIIFVASTILATPLSFAQTLNDARTNGVTIAIANEPPLAQLDKDGAPTGAGPDLDRAILKEAGVTGLSGDVMDYGAMIPAVQSQRATFASGGSLYIKPERCEAVAFSNPVMCGGVSFILPNALADKVHSYKDIAALGLRVGACGGCVMQKLAIDAGVSEDKIIIFPDGTSGVKLLTDNRIDVFSHDTTAGFDLYRRLADPAKYKYVRLTDGPMDCYGAAFNKNNAELRDAYNDGLKKIRASGKYTEILKKYGLEEAAFGTDTMTTEKLCTPH